MSDHLVLRFVLSLICWFSAQACTKPSSTAQLNSYASRGNDRWPDFTIPVCFEQATGFELDKRTVKDSVSREFAAVGFTFTGWELCQVDEKGVRIRFDEQAATSRTFGSGRENDGVIAGLVFGLQSDCAVPYSGSMCEENFALHEFGHILGLRHEMNRRDDPGCRYGQTDNQGEDQAIQLGPYDSSSIMNYCNLYEANAKGQRIGLSAGDQEAIKSLYSGLSASFESIPPFVVQETFRTKVQGSELSTYRYAMGTKSQTNCLDLKTYSDPIDIKTELVIAVDPLLTQSKEMQTLCVLGEDRERRQQSIAAYTSIDFYIDSQTAALSSSPELLEQPVLRLQDANTVALDLRLSHSSALKNIVAILSYKDSRPFASVVSTAAQPVLGEGGRYTLKWKPEDFPVNGAVYLSNLTVNDILGRTRSLDAFSDQGQYSDGSWQVQSTAIDFAPARTSALAELMALTNSASTVKVGELNPLELNFASPTRLANASLTFRSPDGSLSPKISIQADSGSQVRLSMGFPDQSRNGAYRLREVWLEDISGNSRTYRFDETLGAGTSLQGFTIHLEGGLNFEKELPQLSEWVFLPSNLDKPSERYIDLAIKDSSAIAKVSLKLRHSSDQGFYANIFGIDQGEVAGRRRVLLNITEQNPRGVYYVQQVEIEDRWGNRSLLQANEFQEVFPGLELKVPRLTLGL